MRRDSRRVGSLPSGRHAPPVVGRGAARLDGGTGSGIGSRKYPAATAPQVLLLTAAAVAVHFRLEEGPDRAPGGARAPKRLAEGIPRRPGAGLALRLVDEEGAWAWPGRCARLCVLLAAANQHAAPSTVDVVRTAVRRGGDLLGARRQTTVHSTHLRSPRRRRKSGLLPANNARVNKDSPPGVSPNSCAVVF